MPLLRVKACMLAKMIKSSSPLVNSRQLLRLNSTVSSLSSLEHGPPFEPCEHSQPSSRNFLAHWIMVKPYFMDIRLTLEVPMMTNINFLLTISIDCPEIRL